MKKLWLLIPVLLLLSVTRGTADSGILPSGMRASVAQEKPGAWLGVRISATVRKAKDGDTEKNESRVVVEDVVDGSPAENAGIEDGDVLVAFNNVAIGEPKDLTDALKKLKEGDKATVTVLRGGDQKTLDVVLGAAKARKAIVSKSIRVPRPPRIPAAPWAGVFPGRSMFGGHTGYGLTIETLGPQLAEYFGAPGGKGALVKSVKSGSDGEKAGFKAGDVILRAGKKTVTNIADFRSVLGAYDEGEKIPVNILRKGKEMTIDLKARSHGDGLESEHFDIQLDFDTESIEDEERRMRIMLNGREMEIDGLKDVLDGPSQQCEGPSVYREGCSPRRRPPNAGSDHHAGQCGGMSSSSVAEA